MTRLKLTSSHNHRRQHTHTHTQRESKSIKQVPDIRGGPRYSSTSRPQPRAVPFSPRGQHWLLPALPHVRTFAVESHERPKCYGLALRPLCRWGQRQLEVIASPGGDSSKHDFQRKASSKVLIVDVGCHPGSSASWCLKNWISPWSGCSSYVLKEQHW